MHNKRIRTQTYALYELLHLQMVISKPTRAHNMIETQGHSANSLL